MRQGYRYGRRSDHGTGGGYGARQQHGGEVVNDPLDSIWRYHISIISLLEKRKESEKPLRDWFAQDHNSNVAIERRADGYKSVSYTHLTLPTILRV